MIAYYHKQVAVTFPENASLESFMRFTRFLADLSLYMDIPNSEVHVNLRKKQQAKLKLTTPNGQVMYARCMPLKYNKQAGYIVFLLTSSPTNIRNALGRAAERFLTKPGSMGRYAALLAVTTDKELGLGLGRIVFGPLDEFDPDYTLPEGILFTRPVGWPQQ